MTDPNPTQSLWGTTVKRGRLIRLLPGDDRSSVANPALTFQYNPESITFSRTGRWEPRKRRRARDAVQTSQQTFGQAGGHGASALLSESETVSFTLIFDSTERILATDPGPAAGGTAPPAGTDAARTSATGATAAGVNAAAADDPTAAPPPAPARNSADGVLPELGFLQLISLGRDVQQGQQNQGGGTRVRPIRPDELLLQLGDSRWFPCVMTELRVTEQRHNPGLVPIRVECAITLPVLEPVENPYNPLTRQAFEHLMAARVAQSSQVGTENRDVLRAALGGGEAT
ncbi:MAG: hypothetical protein ACK5RL_03950 [Acidimicrobiales bacterium]